MSNVKSESHLAILCRALCDVENQPHQWIGNEKALECEIRRAIEIDGSVYSAGEAAET